MEAIILAAGLGSRLRPLTNNKPKALVEVDGHTLLEINVKKLIKEGAKRIVVNVHHFGELVMQYIASREWEAEIVVSDERDMLLDTGAGVKRALDLLSGKETIVVHNVDILSKISVKELISKHISTVAGATLAVSRRDTKRQLLFARDGQLCGWRNCETGETLYATDRPNSRAAEQLFCCEFAFSGIWVVEPQLLRQMPPADHPYPIVPELLKQAVSYKINRYEHRPEDWLDVGTPERLKKASLFMSR